MAQMEISKKIALFPDKETTEQFFRFAGTARWAYNECLRFRMDRYENEHLTTSVQQCIEHIQDLKHNNSDYDWVNFVPEAITKQTIKDLDKAYKKFFKEHKGYPKFKRKGKCEVSFYQRTDNFKQIDDTHVKITGIRKPVKCSRCSIPKCVCNTRVTFDGKYWYLSYSYKVDINDSVCTDEVVGVDLGIKDLAICSNGNVYKNINKTQVIKRLEKHKRRLQRQLSRKYEMNKQGSKYIKTNNIKKLEQKIRLIDRRLSHIRDTNIHEVTKDLVRTKPSQIVIEDLNVKGMMKNKHLSKAVQQQEFGKFRQYLTYKCQLNGIELIIADRWYPSSKMCSCCDNVKKQLSLSERTYECDVCGFIDDRDHNASLNLENYQKILYKTKSA